VIAHAALEKQAEGVVVLDLRGLCSVTDFFIICTANSVRQLDAIREHVEATLGSEGHSVRHVEGPSPSSPATARSESERLWVLMDCGEVVVHLMDAHTRSFYRLEELWADAPRVGC
jgi:ribosome-associated protein